MRVHPPGLQQSGQLVAAAPFSLLVQGSLDALCACGACATQSIIHFESAFLRNNHSSWGHHLFWMCNAFLRNAKHHSFWGHHSFCMRNPFLRNAKHLSFWERNSAQRKASFILRVHFCHGPQGCPHSTLETIHFEGTFLPPSTRMPSFNSWNHSFWGHISATAHRDALILLLKSIILRAHLWHGPQGCPHSTLEIIHFESAFLPRPTGMPSFYSWNQSFWEHIYDTAHKDALILLLKSAPRKCTSYKLCELKRNIQYVSISCHSPQGCPLQQLQRQRTIHMYRVGQNHIYTVYTRYFWQGNHQIYGHIRCIYTVLANPTHVS